MESSTETGIVVEVGSLFTRIQSLPDLRKPRGKRYSLTTVLIIILLAKLCGEHHFLGIAEWAQHRAAWLVEVLQLKRTQMPHHSTYRRILADGVNAEELEKMSSEFLAGKKYFGKQVLLAMDGKVLRGTLDDQQQGTYLLAAFLPQAGVVLMQIAVAGQGGELPAAPKLLKQIDLRGKVVMGDALHTQKGVSNQIVEAGGEYIWLAKGNQPQMEEDIRLWFEPDVPPIPGMNYPPKDFETAQQTNKGHGRLETRTLTVSSQLKDFLQWPYLEQVFQLERRCISHKTGETHKQVVYGFTSLMRDEMAPPQLLQAVRSYWGIESGLHYRRDVTLREDATRMTKGKAGHVMACLNNLILGLLLTKKKYRTIPMARRVFCAHPQRALTLLTRL